MTANPRRRTQHGTLAGYQIHLEGNDDVGPTAPCPWCIAAHDGTRANWMHPCPCGGWMGRGSTRCQTCHDRLDPIRRELELAPVRRWVRRRGILVAA